LTTNNKNTNIVSLNQEERIKDLEERVARCERMILKLMDVDSERTLPIHVKQEQENDQKMSAILRVRDNDIRDVGGNGWKRLKTEGKHDGK
jgi:uncharacterized coiled-coil protein SlyX